MPYGFASARACPPARLTDDCAMMKDALDAAVIWSVSSLAASWSVWQPLAGERTYALLERECGDAEAMLSDCALGYQAATGPAWH